MLLTTQNSRGQVMVTGRVRLKRRHQDCRRRLAVSLANVVASGSEAFPRKICSLVDSVHSIGYSGFSRPQSPRWPARSDNTQRLARPSRLANTQKSFARVSPVNRAASTRASQSNTARTSSAEFRPAKVVRLTSENLSSTLSKRYPVFVRKYESP